MKSKLVFRFVHSYFLLLNCVQIWCCILKPAFIPIFTLRGPFDNQIRLSIFVFVLNLLYFLINFIFGCFILVIIGILWPLRMIGIRNFANYWKLFNFCWLFNYRRIRFIWWSVFRDIIRDTCLLYFSLKTLPFFQCVHFTLFKSVLWIGFIRKIIVGFDSVLGNISWVFIEDGFIWSGIIFPHLTLLRRIWRISQWRVYISLSGKIL
jgi:hypothetical protein